jgi:hypothetical protein
MSDLEKVIGLAEEKRLEAERQLNLRSENYKKSQEIAARSFEILSSRVSKFAQELKEKAGVYISTNPTTNIIIVSIGSVSPSIQRPYSRITINTTSDNDKYSCRIKKSNKEEKFQGCITLNEVVELLSENAAEFISKRADHTYAPPYWYITTGEIISWPLFVLTWIFCIAIGGVGGFFLGWLPALIVRYTAKFLWLPLLVFIFIKMQG